MNNVWTFSDSGSDTKVNQFLLQPFVNYNFGKGWALSTVPVITANWDAESGQKWTVPIGAGISRTGVFSGKPMTLAIALLPQRRAPGQRGRRPGAVHGRHALPEAVR